MPRRRTLWPTRRRFAWPRQRPRFRWPVQPTDLLIRPTYPTLTLPSACGCCGSGCQVCATDPAALCLSVVIGGGGWTDENFDLSLFSPGVWQSGSVSITGPTGTFTGYWVIQCYQPFGATPPTQLVTVTWTGTDSVNQNCGSVSYTPSPGTPGYPAMAVSCDPTPFSGTAVLINSGGICQLYGGGPAQFTIAPGPC